MVWGHISTSPSDGVCVPDEDDDDHGDGVCGPDEDRADARGELYPQAEAHNPVVSHSRVDNTAVQDSYLQDCLA